MCVSHVCARGIPHVRPPSNSSLGHRPHRKEDHLTLSPRSDRLASVPFAAGARPSSLQAALHRQPLHSPPSAWLRRRRHTFAPSLRPQPASLLQLALRPSVHKSYSPPMPHGRCLSRPLGAHRTWTPIDSGSTRSSVLLCLARAKSVSRFQTSPGPPSLWSGGAKNIFLKKCALVSSLHPVTVTNPQKLSISGHKHALSKMPLPASISFIAPPDFLPLRASDKEENY